MENKKTNVRLFYLSITCIIMAFTTITFAEPKKTTSEPYLKAARRFADTVLEHGRDNYGKDKTPLFVDGLHVKTLEPVKWKYKGETWILANMLGCHAHACVGMFTAYRYTWPRRLGHATHNLKLDRLLDLGDIGSPDGRRKLNLKTDHISWRSIYALLYLYRTAKDRAFLLLASRIADNILKTQKPNGLFPRSDRSYARTGDETPLALLHLAAALDAKESLLPPPILDSRFFHYEFHGDLQEHQKKRDDDRTYDNYVFYRSSR